MHKKIELQSTNLPLYLEMMYKYSLLSSLIDFVYMFIDFILRMVKLAIIHALADILFFYSDNFSMRKLVICH
jgi:hypothetical protein